MACLDQLSRVIEGEVKAAAFAPLECAVDDEFRHLNEVSEFKEARFDAEVPVIFADFVGKGTDARAGSLKALGGTDDSHVVPHRTTKLIPVVRKYHALVRVASGSVDPRWQRYCLAMFRNDLVMGGLGAVVSQDHRFKQGVRGQTISAMEPSAGDFADGE